MTLDTAQKNTAARIVPAKAGKRKDFHKGYQSVLLREDIKDQLREFRARQNVTQDSHLERCLVTAGIELLLSNEALHGAWIEQVIKASSEDMRLAFSAHRA